MHPETMGQPTQKLESSNEVTKVLYKERELEWISTFKNRIFCQHTFKTEDEEGFFINLMLLKGKLWEIFSKWQYILRVVVPTNDRLDL